VRGQEPAADTVQLRPSRSSDLFESPSAIRRVSAAEMGAPPEPAPAAQQPVPMNSEFLAPLAWDIFAQGEYIGPARTAHVPEYFLRVDDTIEFVFRFTGKPSSKPYRLNVGDTVRIASVTIPNLNTDTLIQPDGTIVLPQIGQMQAAGKSVDALRAELDQRYRQFYKEPSITITPLTVNKTLEELRLSILNRNGDVPGQSFRAKVSPNGAIQLPAIGSVPAQGLTLKELQMEIEPRYAEIVNGLEVTPVLNQRAPRAIYVLGEVERPGRFTLEAPTSVIQAIALAGSWRIGGNLKEVIVFRRDENWRLMATRVNVRPALYNSKCLEADDIWLRDSDIVIVSKMHCQVIDDWIELVFTRGIYGIVPFNGVSISFFKDLATVGQL
jgi:polysaccharide export outer membrane protein